MVHQATDLVRASDLVECAIDMLTPNGCLVFTRFSDFPSCTTAHQQRDHQLREIYERVLDKIRNAAAANVDERYVSFGLTKMYNSGLDHFDIKPEQFYGMLRI